MQPLILAVVVLSWRNSTAFRWRLGVAICWQWARKNVVAAGGAQQSANRSQ